MATFTSPWGGSNRSPSSHGFPMHVWWGNITISANPADGDIYKMFYLPAGAMVLGGQLVAADLDTGTEALDIDVGWAADGTSSADTLTLPAAGGTVKTFTSSGTTADPDGFVNAGVLSGDAITDLTAGKSFRPILLQTPLWFAAPTLVQMEANAASAAFAAGDVTVSLWGHIYRK